VPDLALGDQLLHGAGDVLDGHAAVDAALVEQVDPVGVQALERCLGHLPDVPGRLFSPPRRASGLTSKPNLVAMTTWPRIGASASPGSSSLVNGP
jgi:hypothetical protein